MQNRRLPLCSLAVFAAIAVTANPSLAATTTPGITAVYTTYSATGVPTDLSITGTGLCSNSTCSTKPVVKLAGVQQTVSGGTNTGVGVKLGVIADGDYVLTLTVGNASANYNLTIRSGGTGGTGNSASVTVGTTTTGAVGSNASVTNSGTSSAAILNFTIPRGATGATGATGPTGPQGPTGVPGPQGIPGLPGSAGATGATGSAGPVGPAGAKGDKGEAGSAGAGLVYTGAWADATAYAPLDVVTHAGSSYIALLVNTGINPMVDVTATGGYWALLSAKGVDGTAGADGIAGLPGPPGPPGIPGAAGAKGDTGETGAPGVSGTKGDKGDKGEKGDNGNTGPIGPPGPSFGEWSSSIAYAPSALVYTSTDPFGARNFCVYYALAANAGKDPRENSALVADAIWAATDSACRTGATPPPPGVGYTVGGTLSGLATGTAVSLTLTVDGTTTPANLNTNGGFTLPRRVSLGSTYLLAITTQPTGGSCVLANASGIVAGRIDNITLSCAVLSTELQGLEIHNASSTVPIGFPRQYAVNGVAANGVRNDLTLIATWTSSDPSIATVGIHSGRVEGISVGTATISVVYGALITSADITVVSIPLVTTVAGSGLNGRGDGFGLAAYFSSPSGIALGSDGIIYVADRNNQTVRTVNPATGEVKTLAGITGIPGSQDGPAASATFNDLQGIAVDNSGNVYVADTANHKIRKITASGGIATVYTLAGNGVGGYDDSPDAATDGSTARFNAPIGITVDSTGQIYVADTGNHVIRKIAPSGITTTLAGSGHVGQEDGLGTSASFYAPWTLAIDSVGNLFVGGGGASNTIRRVTPDGLVTTHARIGGPAGLAISKSGKMYVVAGCSIFVSDISATDGRIEPFTGSCGYRNGPINEAQMFPKELAVDNQGTLYFSDWGNSVIRKISPIP